MPPVRSHRRFEMHFSHLVGAEPEPADLFLDVVGACASRGAYDYTQTASAIFLRFMHRGAGFAQIRGRTIPLAAGQLFIYWPGKPVRFHDRPESPWDFTFMQLGGRDPGAALRRAGFPIGSRCFDLAEAAPAVLREAHSTLDRFRTGDLGTLYPVAQAWRLLLLASEAIGLASSLPLATGLAQRCRDLIREQEGAVEVASLAAALGVSRTTLFRAFVASYAMSPKEYIEQVRFERACHLLSTTTLAVAEIARRCHVEDPDYFARRFHRRFNLPPTAWRRNRQQLAADGLGRPT